MDAARPQAEDDSLLGGLPRPGDLLLGKYRVERVIGRGGMGVVYAANHEALGQRVALKVLSPAAAAQKASATRFLNEARAAARIKDEHVASVMDVGLLENDVPYMVLEYLDGKDLSRVLEERGPLPVTEVVDYVLQALSAIAQAHAAGIVHRDLKPGNLFLATKPDGGTAIKVLDFGISKLEGATAEITHTAAVLGSPGYMAPEQVRSSRTVDGRADIWSLGVILYRLLTNEVPFQGESMGAVFAAILEETPPGLRQARPDLPEALERVILKCLEKERDARWASAGDLAAALAPFASPEGERIATRIGRTLTTSGTRLAALSSSASLSSSPSLGSSSWGPRISIHSQQTQMDPAVSRAGTAAGLKKRGGLALIVAIVVLGAGAALVARAWKGGPTARPVASSDRAAATTGATPWYARAPKGASDKYALGLKALREGFNSEASEAFQGATQENVWLGPAYLRRSILELTHRPDEVRVDFARAVEHQDRLDARDLPLLEAFRHQLVDTPPDDAAWEAALVRMSDLAPDDAELAYYRGLAHWFRGKPDLAIAAYERAIANDPQFAAALAALAQVSAEIGDLERAKKAVDACLALPRRSPACSRERIRLLSRTGDAPGVLAEAEAWIKGDPLHADEANAFKAEAMLELGSAIPAVEETIRQRTRRLPDERSRTKLHWVRQLAELKGDFPAAEQALNAQRDFAKENSLERRDYAAAAVALVEFYGETGRDAEGATVARDFLAKEEAWAPDRTAPHIALATDPIPKLLAAELRAKTLDRPAFEAALAAWAARWRTRVSPRFVRSVWVYGYAAIADSKELADDALAVRARFDANDDPPLLPFEEDVALGRVYAAAGDYDRARPHLERATHALWTLHAVIVETQIEELYGESLERTDATRACAAYAGVLGRWGTVKGSVTLARATSRARALRCPAAASSPATR